jgi:hypothetical protein
MIYRIDDKWAWEGKFQERKELIEIYKTLNKNDLSTLLLYKYKLNDFIGVRKLGINNPDKIDYSKIEQDCIMVYHLDIFINDPSKIQDLVDYCLENNKDLYVPVGRSDDPQISFWSKRKDRWACYSEILDKYECTYIDDIKSFSRDIKLKSLLF